MCTERFYNVCYKDIVHYDVFLTLKLEGRSCTVAFAIQIDTQIIILAVFYLLDLPVPVLLWFHLGFHCLPAMLDIQIAPV